MALGRRDRRGLGATGSLAAVFAGPAAEFDELADDLMRPIVHLPRHPLRLLRFGRPRCCRPR